MNIKQWHKEMNPEMIRIYNLSFKSWIEVRNNYWIYKHVYYSGIWKFFTSELLHLAVIPFLLLLFGYVSSWTHYHSFEYLRFVLFNPLLYAVVWCALSYLFAFHIMRLLDTEINRIILRIASKRISHIHQVYHVFSDYYLNKNRSEDLRHIAKLLNSNIFKTI
jgi:hypothetical protein